MNFTALAQRLEFRGPASGLAKTSFGRGRQPLLLAEGEDDEMIDSSESMPQQPVFDA